MCLEDRWITSLIISANETTSVGRVVNLSG